MTKPYRMKRLGIMNRVGGIWTAETLDSEDIAREYIATYARRWSMDLSRHTVVPVNVTVSAIKPRAAPTAPPVKTGEG